MSQRRGSLENLIAEITQHAYGKRQASYFLSVIIASYAVKVSIHLNGFPYSKIASNSFSSILSCRIGNEKQLQILRLMIPNVSDKKTPTSSRLKVHLFVKKKNDGKLIKWPYLPFAVKVVLNLPSGLVHPCYWIRQFRRRGKKTQPHRVGG